MTDLPNPLPLFPLQLVLLPGELLPLHIFEPRYREMIAHCRETGEPFGMVVRLADGVASLGCTARLVAVVEEFPDGRSSIVVRGEAPFRVDELLPPDDPIAEALAARVGYLDDDPWEPDGAAVARVEGLLLRILSLLGEDAVLPEPDPDAVAVTSSAAYRLAGRLQLELGVKQLLLGSRDESQRLALLADHLETLVARLELLESRREAIRGNGKGN